MAHELIKRDYIYRGRVLDLSVSRFNSEAKGEIRLEIVHHNGGAGAIPIFEDGTIGLVRQWRYPAGRYSTEICAGRIEAGASAEETAARELEEEMGLCAKSLRKITNFLVAPGYCEERIHLFVATEISESKQMLDEDEEIEVVRLPYAEAIAMIHDGNIDDAKSIIALLLAGPIIEAKLQQ